jgi:hypothetical protein
VPALGSRRGQADRERADSALRVTRAGAIRHDRTPPIAVDMGGFGTVKPVDMAALERAIEAAPLSRSRCTVRAVRKTVVRFARPRDGGTVMQDIMIRIETDDFEAWKAQHYLHADDRAAFGISDGPAYQDIDNPNAALFHIRTDDMDRAMQWFKSDIFKEASRLAKVSGRVFYLAQPQT